MLGLRFLQQPTRLSGPPMPSSRSFDPRDVTRICCAAFSSSNILSRPFEIFGRPKSFSSRRGWPTDLDRFPPFFPPDLAVFVVGYTLVGLVMRVCRSISLFPFRWGGRGLLVSGIDCSLGLIDRDKRVKGW